MLGGTQGRQRTRHWSEHSTGTTQASWAGGSVRALVTSMLAELLVHFLGVLEHIAQVLGAIPAASPQANVDQLA